MGELIYSTKLILDGPWLLDAKALKELDLIISKHWDLLETNRKELLQQAVESEQIIIAKRTSSDTEYIEQIELYRYTHPIYSRSVRRISILYRSFNYACDKFETAFQEISLTNSIPLGFIVYISSGEVDCQIALYEKSGLEISTIPEGSNQAQGLFTELGNWAKQNYAPWWQRWWERLAKTGLRFYIYLSGFALALTFLGKFLRLNSNVLLAQKDAQTLLETGLNDNNMPNAIALLLRTQIMDRFSIQLYPTLFVLASIVIFGIIFSIRPKIVVGIGRGSNQLRLWKGWLGFIGAAIPGFILTFIILPVIANWIMDILKIP